MSVSSPESGAAPVAANVERMLAGFAPDARSDLPPRVQRALFVASQLQRRASELQTSAERRQQVELDRMMQSPGDKATLMQMTDQAFRSVTAARACDQLTHVLDAQGVPRFFSPLDRTLLRGFQSFGGYLPSVVMPLVKGKMRHETANVVLPAEEDLLNDYLLARRREGVRMNVNHLGESLLGEREARRRLDGYLAALQRPEIEVISVKISTIYSQVSPLAREHTVGVLADRLELLYRAAAKGRFTRPDGSVVPKFVYLDMEEYRDLWLTSEAFTIALDRTGLEHVSAGIALQAYIPDSLLVQRRLCEWARRRVASGGAPITIRLVKGANLEMERVEASLMGWPQAPYTTKLETDANYKRMLHEGLREENRDAVHLGIASHNLFTLAYGLVCAAEARAADRIHFEMLEGMAAHQRRALFEQTGDLLLYAPACERDDFIHAIGYLVRRLDENTGEDNFLRHAFNITVGSEPWRRLERHFVESFDAIETVPAEPRRSQDRGRESFAEDTPLVPFTNESDTDWSLPHNSAWGEAVVRAARRRFEAPTEVLPVIGGSPIDGDDWCESIDPSRPGTVVARYVQAKAQDIDHAIACAAEDRSGWRSRSVRERRKTLAAVATRIATRRFELLGAMLAEGGKTLLESDPEISEAIDFCRFYGESAESWLSLPGVTAAAREVIVVVSPWNFPFAIPCGGVAAALAAGSNVILKPASDTVLIAQLLCECFWEAGVPRAALQFAPCAGATAGERLATDPRVGAVILTGGTETARRMLAAKPTMRLFAETGGKNATIVTALADRELAIKNVLHSAFGHAGQKCSATSLLILDDEVYHDPGFRETLADAVESLCVGSAWDLPTKIGPLIRPPSGDLEQGLKELEAGESWLVMPRLHVNDNPHLVSPSVKWGVAPGSFTHRTEFFGPLLGVMRAKNLAAAIDLVNATGYGLTSGLESLDDREHEVWRRGVRAGNLYINRPTTGAIVLRQPFGGVGKSSVGPGMKAGGPNYVAQFVRFRAVEASPHAAIESDRQAIEDDLLATLLTDLEDAWAESPGEPLLTPGELAELRATILDYELAAREEFRQEHDHFRLVGEDNLRRYAPVDAVRCRVHPRDNTLGVLIRLAAGRVAGCHMTISHPTGLGGKLGAALLWLHAETDAWAGRLEFVEETDEELAEIIRSDQADRLDYAAPDRVPDAIRLAASNRLLAIIDTPTTGRGRLDLLWRHSEQSVSHVYHRYGNLAGRVPPDEAT